MIFCVCTYINVYEDIVDQCYHTQVRACLRMHTSMAACAYQHFGKLRARKQVGAHLKSVFAHLGLCGHTYVWVHTHACAAEQACVSVYSIGADRSPVVSSDQVQPFNIFGNAAGRGMKT